MKSTDIGKSGEDKAVQYLEERGFQIVERNWRTRYCEIDIVALKSKTMHFVEVKSRKTTAYGDGFDYVTPKKQKQMKFAAEMWIQAHDWPGDVCLSAMSITADEIEFIDTL